MIAPNTDLILLKCPIELDQANQLTFPHATAQYNYFNGLTKLELGGFTYQRKDGKIRYPACADDLYSYNYCMYRNSSYSNRWFYAFITNIEYLNDNTSLISIKTDVWQTWQFDLTFKRSFISREHTNNDAFGANTLDEGLNVGEYVCNASSSFYYMSNTQDYVVAVQVTDLLGGLSGFSGNKRIYGGVPQGTYVLCCDINAAGDPDMSDALNRLIYAYDKNGKADAITAMYILPKVFLGANPMIWSLILPIDGGSDEIVWDGYKLRTSTGAQDLGRYEWDRQTTLNGYTPKNAKTLQYPYNYLMISNNAGTTNVYHWEDFASSQAWFSMRGVPTQGCQIRVIPEAYKGTNFDGGYEWSCLAPDLPLVSWNSDYYLNWQAKNGFQSGFNATYKYSSDYVSAGKEVAAGNANPLDTGNLIAGISETLGTFGQMFNSIMGEVSGGYSASITPDQSRGVSSGDLTYAMGKTCFTGYKMSVKYQQAKAIDDYFSMYGYRTDQVKIPNITGRLNWNYVQTMGLNVIADIPQEDLNQIKGMFNAGVTLWHNAATFLDYSQSNNIV